MAAKWVSSAEYTQGHMTLGRGVHTLPARADLLAGGVYEILVSASLDESWADWFDGFEFQADPGRTRLRGSLADQAALHGVLARFRDLGIPILAVRRLRNGTPHPGDEDESRGNTPPGT